MADDAIIANKIDRRFSFDNLDYPVMVESVEATIRSVESLVLEAIAEGEINDKLLRSALCSLAHASARAQEEFSLVRDDVLPTVWTALAFKSPKM